MQQADSTPSELHQQSSTPALGDCVTRADSSRMGDVSGGETAVLDGLVAACACPECGAPMSVRRWLMTADCWRCEVSISLSYLLEEKIAEFSSPGAATEMPGQNNVEQDGELERRRPRERTGSIAREPHPGSQVRMPESPPDLEEEQPGYEPALYPVPCEKPQPADTQSTSIPLPPRFVEPRRRSWQKSLRDFLACLLSIIAHLLLLILLAYLSFGRRDDFEQIRLSMNIDPMRIEGEQLSDRAIEHVGFKLPVDPPPVPTLTPEEMEAQRWARQLQVSRDAVGSSLPEFSRVKDAVESNDQYRRMLAARDPRIRQELVRNEGGTTQTEAAVARALFWFASHQSPDGSWSIHAFHREGDCNGRCGGTGSVRSDAGGTALALQAMLGAGQTHRSGIYQEQVWSGLNYLLNSQLPDGDLRGKALANAGMYVHALGTIALCDALALTGDPDLYLPAKMAIQFVVDAQHGAGGWRYQPRTEGDTSVVGWQLMALHSARAAGIAIPDNALIGADSYLNTAQTDSLGAFYAYRPGGRPTPAMTAEGLLSRMYLGWRKNDPGLRTGVLTMAREYPPDPSESNIYYWYYGTQVMHHWGGRPWDRWNQKMRDILVASQIRRGHEAGSWDPNTPHGHQGGRLYMTALACCTLEVYYRHAPLFRKIRLD